MENLHRSVFVRPRCVAFTVASVERHRQCAQLGMKRHNLRPALPQIHIEAPAQAPPPLYGCESAPGFGNGVYAWAFGAIGSYLLPSPKQTPCLFEPPVWSPLPTCPSKAVAQSWPTWAGRPTRSSEIRQRAPGLCCYAIRDLLRICLRVETEPGLVGWRRPTTSVCWTLATTGLRTERT